MASRQLGHESMHARLGAKARWTGRCLGNVENLEAFCAHRPGIIFGAHRTITSAEDAVAVAPSDQDVNRPDPRPVHAGRPFEERAPETLHCYGIEPDWSDSLRVPQG